MNELIKIAALYAGSILTIFTFAISLFRASDKFSSWISNKIVQRADMSKRSDYICKKDFDRIMNTVLDKLNHLDEIKLATKRLEYLNIRQHNSEDKMLINMIYDEYKHLGGNSYIDMDHEKWKTESSNNIASQNKKQNKKAKTA